jgi:transposase-like protein
MTGQEALCRKCGHHIRCVADIAPTAAHPGISAYVCTSCGHATSVLVYGPAKSAASSHLNQTIRASAPPRTVKQPARFSAAIVRAR